jgi:hypothetical protein
MLLVTLDGVIEVPEKWQGGFRTEEKRKYVLDPLFAMDDPPSETVTPANEESP